MHLLLSPDGDVTAFLRISSNLDLLYMLLYLFVGLYPTFGLHLNFLYQCLRFSTDQTCGPCLR